MKRAVMVVALLFALAPLAVAGSPSISVEPVVKYVKRPELSRTVYDGPAVSVGDIWTRRPELSRTVYGEPKITVGDVCPARRPELSRWAWLTRLFAR